MENAQILNGIIARFDKFRVEYDDMQAYEKSPGQWGYEPVALDYFSEDLSLNDYHAFEKGHPNYIICQTLWKYLRDEIGIRLKYTNAVSGNFLELLKFVYKRASKAREDYNLIEMPPYPYNIVPQTYLPHDVEECLESPLIRGSIVSMLLQMDTSVKLTSNEIARAEELYCRPLISEKEKPFYTLLSEALGAAFPGHINQLDPKIRAVFKHPNEYVREKVAEAIKLCVKKVDYALLELSLEEGEYINTIGKHKALCDALTAWGLVQQGEKKTLIYNNMKEKYADLVKIQPKDWTDKDKRKYEAFLAVFNKKPQKNR
jgi:hypothetical protein